MIELVNDVGVTLVNVSASDDMVAMAAWVSHDADNEARLEDRKKVKGLINFLYRNNHTSPFEHGLFTFKIDAPLFVAREFFRHRTASYNEVSGRYTKMQPRFYAGDTARLQAGKPGDYTFHAGNNEQTAIYRQSKIRALESAWEVYEQRLEAGIAKEQAREELPLSLMTQWYVTMNPLNLMKFLSLRDEDHALKEIRDVAVKMDALFKEAMPLTYEAYRARRDEQDDRESLKGTIAGLAKENKALKSAVSELSAEVSRLTEQLAQQEHLLIQAAEAAPRAKKPFDIETPREAFDRVKARAEAKLAGKSEEEWTFEKMGLDYIVENVAPVAKAYYNIVVNNETSPEDIARTVLKALKAQEARRPRRRN